ncbi:MAG: class II aldolase/adducin family protein [Halieaceae bacterium]|jgi:L-fuculose-phosphate aldolase|nr:class II aldolase/adducin family protein [Halieaceae bacterium]
MSDNRFTSADFDSRIAGQLLLYARLVARRGYVINTLGNIAIRTAHACDADYGVVYTKHMGVSLEEMNESNIVVTDIPNGDLLFGNRATSVGHALNRTVFRYRPDINAVIHLHIDELIAYFTVTAEREFRYISADTPLVMSLPVLVLQPSINVEIDTHLLQPHLHDTNCVIMPNHGITTFGRDVSEAYHRINSAVAEVRRIVLAHQIAAATGKAVNWICDREVGEMYRDSERVIYGDP